MTCPPIRISVRQMSFEYSIYIQDPSGRIKEGVYHLQSYDNPE